MEAVEAPDIIPCFNGQELNVDKELVNACLMAISMKKMPEVIEETLKPDLEMLSCRNSFVNLHRPEMTKVPAAPKSVRKLNQFFKDQAKKLGINSNKSDNNTANPQGFNCEQPQETDQIRCLLEARDSFGSKADTGTMLSSSATKERIVNCSIPLTDEDLSPGEFPRKSRAQFCVLMRGFNSLPQETTDLMHEAADRLIEGSMETKPACRATKKNVANESTMSSPGSLYCSAEPKPDFLSGPNAAIVAKSCPTNRKNNKAN